MIVIPIRSIRLLDQYPKCDINASSFTANSTTHNMAAPNSDDAMMWKLQDQLWEMCSSATQTTVPTAPAATATSAEGGSMAWMFVGIPAHPPKLERHDAECPSAQAEETSCPLHPDPMPGLWYTPNARGEYSMYAPACNGKGPKCHPAAPAANQLPAPASEWVSITQLAAVPAGECPMADAPTELSHTVAAQAKVTSCPLHPDPMPGLWYTPNARGEYSMYAPACNGKGPKCH